MIHGTISVDGRERTYRLYVPSTLPSDPAPLFIGLHGGTGWGDQFAQTNHVEGLAESNGFITVHPDGLKVASGPGGVWNGADTNLPLAGGVGPDSIAGVDFPVPRAGFDQIAVQQACPVPTTSTIGDVTVASSEPCAGDAAMEFVTIESANHAWPGGTPRLTPASGPGYAGYDATSEIVAFLLAHPRA